MPHETHRSRMTERNGMRKLQAERRQEELRRNKVAQPDSERPQQRHAEAKGNPVINNVQ